MPSYCYKQISHEKKILCPINAKLEVLIFLIYKQFEYYFWFVYCYRSKHICGMGYRHDISISLWYKSSSIKCCSVWWTQNTTEREHCCWLSCWKRLSVMIYDDWHMEIYQSNKCIIILYISSDPICVSLLR